MFTLEGYRIYSADVLDLAPLRCAKLSRYLVVAETVRVVVCSAWRKAVASVSA